MIKIVPEVIIRQRLNTRLAARGECLRKHQIETRSPDRLDAYYIAILDTDQVVCHDVRLEELARQEGVIHLGESMTTD